MFCVLIGFKAVADHMAVDLAVDLAEVRQRVCLGAFTSKAQRELEKKIQTYFCDINWSIFISISTHPGYGGEWQTDIAYV